MYNQVTLVGNVGKDADCRYSQTGVCFSGFSLATSESYRDGQEWKELTSWHKVEMFADLAEKYKDKIKKGMKVMVTGSLKYSEYTSADGHNVRVAFVKAARIIILSQQTQQPKYTPRVDPVEASKDMPDDLPF